MKCVVEGNCAVVKTECWACEDYAMYRPKDKRILSPRQERNRLKRKVSKKEKKNSPASKRGRNNRLRGKAWERKLLKLLEAHGIPVRKVACSGALKATGGLIGAENDIYAGDLVLEGKSGENYRIEVKSRTALPAYVTKYTGLKDYCMFLDEAEFIALCVHGVYEPSGVMKEDTRTQTLHDWFDQDDSAIVAMKVAHTPWRFAIKLEQVSKIKQLGGIS